MPPNAGVLQEVMWVLHYCFWIISTVYALSALESHCNGPRLLSEVTHEEHIVEKIIAWKGGQGPWRGRCIRVGGAWKSAATAAFDDVREWYCAASSSGAGCSSSAAGVDAAEKVGAATLFVGMTVPGVYSTRCMHMAVSYLHSYVPPALSGSFCAADRYGKVSGLSEMVLGMVKAAARALQPLAKFMHLLRAPADWGYGDMPAIFTGAVKKAMTLDQRRRSVHQPAELRYGPSQPTFGWVYTCVRGIMDTCTARRRRWHDGAD